MTRSTPDRAAALALLLALGACGPTPYEPAGALDDTGYASERLAENRYRVRFEGNARTSRETVETYLLYRAAEVADRTGHPYFAIVEQEVERDVDLEPYFAPPGFYGWGPRWGYPPNYGTFPYYTTYSYPPTGPLVSTTDAYEASAIVALFEARPDERDDFFTTAQVLRSLAPEIAR